MIALFSWVVETEEDLPGSALREYLRAEKLEDWLAEEEAEILEMDRADSHDQHADTIGWRLENIWGLAWVLGFETPPARTGMIANEITDAVFEGFVGGGVLPSVASVVAAHRARTVEEVDALEDLFYCLHNAVRSAQLGRNTVPSGFHPIADGGGIHERRHALTWCLSPGVDWDDTDLST